MSSRDLSDEAEFYFFTGTQCPDDTNRGVKGANSRCVLLNSEFVWGIAVLFRKVPRRSRKTPRWLGDENLTDSNKGCGNWKSAWRKGPEVAPQCRSRVSGSPTPRGTAGTRHLLQEQKEGVGFCRVQGQLPSRRTWVSHTFCLISPRRLFGITEALA